MSKENNISVKFLIHLVGERPALWDKTSEDYKDRALRETSWREICTFINENYGKMPTKPKEEFTRMITRKWTHIRDSWVKSMKYGYDEITKLPPKPYIYHDELKFMQKILKCKPPRYNLNQSQLSNKTFEEFYREKNEVHDNSNDISNAAEESEDGGNYENVSFKQEPNISLEADHTEDDNMVEDEDNWPLESNEVEPIIQEEELKPKKKRRSIFKNSRGEDDSIDVSQPLPSPPALPPRPPQVIPVRTRSTSTSQKQDPQLDDNRHWNFFKGILPSVCTLDEDHILQFQSGVIVLLQKLRESQKQKPKTYDPNRVSSHSLLRGRGRKRKASRDDDYVGWPMHTVDVPGSYATRNSRRHKPDPIAAEDSDDDFYSDD